MSPRKGKNAQSNSQSEDLELNDSLSNSANKRQSLSRSAKIQESREADSKTFKREMLQFFAKVVGLTEDNRFICDLFHELPSRKEYPDYYQAITRPICLDMIKANIESSKYNDWSSLFGDFEQLVINAKTYNMPGSEVYEDASMIDNFCKSYPTYQKSSSKPKKRTQVDEISEDVDAKQSNSSKSSKRERHSISQQTNQGIDEIDAKSKKAGSANKRAKNSGPPKSVLELMTYVSKNEDDDFPYSFHIPLPKDLNQLFPTKLDGVAFSWTLLHCAAYYGHKGLVDHLIELGADKEIPDDNLGSTPLIWAAYNGKYETCQLLVEKHNANVKAQNMYEQYPLDIVPDSSDPKWVKLLSTKRKYKPRKNESTISDPNNDSPSAREDTPKGNDFKTSKNSQADDQDSSIPDFSSFNIEDSSANHFLAILTKYSNAMKMFLKEFLEFSHESGLGDTVNSLSEYPSFLRPHAFKLDLANQNDAKFQAYLDRIKSPVTFNQLLGLNRTIRNFDFFDFQMNLIFENAIKSHDIVTEYNLEDINKLKELYEKYRDKFRSTSPGKDMPTSLDHRNVTDYLSCNIRGVLYGLNDFVIVKDPDYKDPVILQIIKISRIDEKFYLTGPRYINPLQLKPSHHPPPNTDNQCVFKVKNTSAISEDIMISLCLVEGLKNRNSIPINLPIPPNLIFYCGHRYVPDSRSPFQIMKEWRTNLLGDTTFALYDSRKPVKVPVNSDVTQSPGVGQQPVKSSAVKSNPAQLQTDPRKSLTPSMQLPLAMPGQNPYLTNIQPQGNAYPLNQIGQPESSIPMNSVFMSQPELQPQTSNMHQNTHLTIRPAYLSSQLPQSAGYPLGTQTPYKLYSQQNMPSAPAHSALPYSLQQSISPQISMANLQSPQLAPPNLQLPLHNQMGQPPYQSMLPNPSLPHPPANQFMKPTTYMDHMVQQQQYQLQQQFLQQKGLSQQEQLIQRQQQFQQQRLMEQQVRQQSLQAASMYSQLGTGTHSINNTAALGLSQMAIPNSIVSQQSMIGTPSQTSDPQPLSAGSLGSNPYIPQKLPQPQNPGFNINQNNNTPSPMISNVSVSPIPPPSHQLSELVKNHYNSSIITSIAIESLQLFWKLDISPVSKNNHYTFTVPHSNAQILIKCETVEPRLRKLIKLRATLRSSELNPLPSTSDKLSEKHKDFICLSVPLKTGVNPIKCQVSLPKLMNPNGQEVDCKESEFVENCQWYWPKDCENSFTIIINRLE